MSNKRIACILLLALFLFGSSLIIRTYARYDSGVSGNIGIYSAIAITEDNLEETLNYELNDMIPGDIKTYNFSISNYKNDKMNEITINYKIKILKSNNIPVTVDLYKNDSLINCLNENLECLDNILGYGVAQTDNYQLVITWDSTDNSYIYSDYTDYIDVKIESLQVVE